MKKTISLILLGAMLLGLLAGCGNAFSEASAVAASEQENAAEASVEASAPEEPEVTPGPASETSSAEPEDEPEAGPRLHHGGCGKFRGRDRKRHH